MNPIWETQPTANPPWTNVQYSTPSWKIPNNNSYPSKWSNTAAQNPNWNQNWQHPMEITSQPIGMAPKAQPTLQAPLQLPLKLNT
jgi:hypothetical protein